jgi:glycerol-3-phosphate dehydrogenase
VDESRLDLSWRGRAHEALVARTWDLLVVGGGIVGAGIAAEAARAGLAVALLDRADFASATSSASSKLIHGGLRYLRLGDVRLVREAHRERRALLRVVAPHLVRRLPFLVPLYPGSPYRPATLQAGLWLYSTLARERIGGLAPPERARRSVPDLRLGELRGCGVYADAWTNDARLCLANVRAAADAGATVLNYAEVVALRTERGRVAGADVRDALDGSQFGVRARAVVNATGPWVDRVRRLEDPAAGPSSRLSKGVHVVVPLRQPWSAALTLLHSKVRISFAVPWDGLLLLGTTDTLYDGDPAEVRATADDVRQVLDEAALGVDPELLRPELVLSTYAGVRVLPGAAGETTTARRETVFLRGPGGMLSVAGGKLTTYRRIALEALARLRVDLGLGRLDASPRPLPGAARPAEVAARLARTYPELDPTARSHLAHRYGSLADEVLAPARDDPSLLERLHPEAPELAAEAAYAIEREWATGPDDVLRRRTTLALRGLGQDADVLGRA